MIDPAVYLAYVLTVLGLLCLPGPDWALTTSASALLGRRAGLAAAGGILSGELLHTLLASAGLAAVLTAFPDAFRVVRLLGAAYLVYLGVRAFRARQHDGEARPPQAARPGVLYAQGLATNALSPATATFFLALLPQFVHPERGHAGAQILLLGGTYVLLDGLIMLVLVLAAARLCGWLAARPRAGTLTRLAGGALLVALGARLVLAG